MKPEIKLENPKGRLTAKKLVEWLNKKFEQLDITEYEIIDVKRTYYTSDQYEGGACKQHIYFKNKGQNIEHPSDLGTMMCFYNLKELEYYINNGWEMYFRVRNKFGNRFLIISDLELDVKREFRR